MKTDKLEDFVRANREEFDFREPSAELWNKISKEAKPTKRIYLHSYFLRVAAVIAIVMVSSVLVWHSGILSGNRLAKNQNNPQLMELMEAEAFYSHQVNKKLKEIQKCYYTYPELKEEIETDLSELEDLYKTLKKDLKENVANKSVIEAMIENNRFRLKLCDDVLEQIKC